MSIIDRIIDITLTDANISISGINNYHYTLIKKRRTVIVGVNCGKPPILRTNQAANIMQYWNISLQYYKKKQCTPKGYTAR